jgi:hypothetical protein
MLFELPVHDIPDGSERADSFHSESERIWPDEDGVNILETPLGSHMFVSSYLHGKCLKHRLLLQFIKYVAVASFPREEEQMQCKKEQRSPASLISSAWSKITGNILWD